MFRSALIWLRHFWQAIPAGALGLFFAWFLWPLSGPVVAVVGGVMVGAVAFGFLGITTAVARP